MKLLALVLGFIFLMATGAVLVLGLGFIGLKPVMHVSKPQALNIVQSATRTPILSSHENTVIEVNGSRIDMSDAKRGVAETQQNVARVAQNVADVAQKVAHVVEGDSRLAQNMAQVGEVQRVMLDQIQSNPPGTMVTHHIAKSSMFMPGWMEIIVIFFFIGFLVIPVLILLLVVRAARGSGSDRQARQEDSKLAQELYDLQKKLEKRVESLETIILDEVRADRGDV